MAAAGTSDRLHIAGVAALAGVKRHTIDVHRKRGTMPEPDGMDGRRPWWHADTVYAWLRERPVRGQRRAGTTTEHAAAGRLGAHVRWHEATGRTDDECPHCG